MAAKLRKGDKVVVLSGRDKGKEGEVAQVMPKTDKVIVSGINISIRATKQSANSQGGRIPKEMPMNISNVALVDPKDGGPTRVGFKMDGDKKVRYAKKSGAVIDA